MKIVKLMGGLGNQMFQYAFGAALGDDVYYDKSWFKIMGNATPRQYELGVFYAPVKFATPTHKIPRFIRKIFGVSSNGNLPRINEKHAQVYCPELIIKDTGYFTGYFQSEKYFAHIRPRILNDFSLQIPLNDQNKQVMDIIHKCENPVSLHVRRGDYVNLTHIHGLCDLDYYKRAIDYIAEHVKNPHFFLFSDDIDWVRHNLPINYPFTVVDINDSKCGYFDLELMKNCKHNIIANSSFSWWGAWLNENPNKIVISPQRWMANKDTPDIIPDTWTKM